MSRGTAANLTGHSTRAMGSMEDYSLRLVAGNGLEVRDTLTMPVQTSRYTVRTSCGIGRDGEHGQRAVES